MGPLSVDEVSIPWLQWGRDLVIAEIRRRSVILLLDRPASMGPRSGDRGNSAGMLRARAVISASMGPRSGDRGNERSQPGHQRRFSRFNGAAIWRSRKSAQIGAAQISPSRFNGAAIW